MSAPTQNRSASGPRVGLFATCINDAMFPDTPKAVVTVLERLGCTVTFPTGQTCCGQVFTNSGYWQQSVPLVRGYVDAFRDCDYIVAPSGSCVGSIREQHEMLAQWQGDDKLAEEVAAVAAKTYDFPELLIDVLGVTDVGAYFPHKVTYHPTCHSLRITKVGDRPYQLLQNVRGLELLPLTDADRCCGFGGTFSLKNPDISVAMTTDKARHVADTGAEFLVAGDNSCLLSIGGVLARGQSQVKTIHLAEILAHTEESYA